MKLVLCLLFLSTTSRCNTESPVERLESDFWQWRLAESPELGASLGLRPRHGRLERFSMDVFRQRVEWCEELLRRIVKLYRSRQPAITLQRRIRLRMLHQDVTLYVQGFRWSSRCTLNPVNNLEGAQRDFVFWADSIRLGDAEDVGDYIDTLRALASQVFEQISLMRQAVRLEWTNHRLAVDQVTSSLHLLSDPSTVANSSFSRPLNDTLRLKISESERELLLEEGLSVIRDQVFFAFKQMQSFFKREYLPSTRKYISAQTLPDGALWYRQCIRWYTSYDEDPANVHNAALFDVERITNRIEQLASRVQFFGPAAQFMQRMRTDDMFFHQYENQVMQDFELLLKRRLPNSRHLFFYNFTIRPIRLLSMPFDGAPVVHMPSLVDTNLPSVLFVNTHRPTERPRWEIPAFSLFYYYGEHFLTSYSWLPDVPLYRRASDYFRLSPVPFQLPNYRAFAEGWSSYAVSLGYQAGIFENPYHEYGFVYRNLVNAARAVVDTGIHSFGWSEQRSVRFLVSRCAMSRPEALRTVQLSVTYPASGLAASVGRKTIERLLSRAKLQLGDDFSLREFHHQVLRFGPLQLRHLEENVNLWLAHSSSPSTRCRWNRLAVCIAMLAFSLSGTFV